MYKALLTLMAFLFFAPNDTHATEEDMAAALVLRPLSGTEQDVLRTALEIEASTPLPEDVLQLTRYYGRNMDSDVVAANLRRLYDLSIPDDQRMLVLGAFFTWLEGEGKDIVSESQEDPLKELGNLAPVWAEDEETPLNESLMSYLIVDSDTVDAYILAARTTGLSFGQNDDSDTSDDEDPYVDMAELDEALAKVQTSGNSTTPGSPFYNGL